MDRRGGESHFLFVGDGADTRWDELEVAFDGADVDRVETTEEALERLVEPTFDCVLVDHRPPAADCVELGRRLLRNHPTVPCVLVGGAKEETKDRFRRTHSRRTVADGGPTAVTDAVESAVRQRYEELPDPDTPPVSDPVKDVDEAAVDELVAGEIQRETARELIHKSQLFDTIFDNLPANLFVKDERGRHLHVSNPEGDGGDVDDRGLTDPELVPEPFATHGYRAFEDDQYVIDTGEAIMRKEEYIPPLDRWNRTSKIPWRDRDGDVVGLIGIAHDVTEQKRHERVIKRQNERLEQFASVVSHDLRGPLGVARGNLELAMERRDGDTGHLESVAEAHERMDSLIDNVLSLAREGSAVTEPESLQLSDVVEDAWETAETGDASLVVSEDATFLADPAQVSRLFENLFRNAATHGPEGVTVTVGRLADGDGFYVADDGPGIPPADRQSVFEMGVTTERSSTGFGLAIVDQIADGHGWDVTLTDAADGGARFEFSGVSPGPQEEP